MPNEAELPITLEDLATLVNHLRSACESLEKNSERLQKRGMENFHRGNFTTVIRHIKDIRTFVGHVNDIAEFGEPLDYRPEIASRKAQFNKKRKKQTQTNPPEMKLSKKDRKEADEMTEEAKRVADILQLKASAKNKKPPAGDQRCQ